jgi:Ni/Co efflux regulator RcnB
MNKFVIATLAATALVPVSANAQTATAASQAQSGVTWQHRGGQHNMQGGQHVRRGGQHAMPGGHHMRRGGKHAMPGDHHMRGGKHMRRGGKHFVGRHHGFNRFEHRRIDRGFIVPQFWWGPQFQIQNWNRYGFSQPIHGSRWIRYYDDALMVDQYGRVLDGRYGMNWDNHADQWAYDDQGIPYYGNGDYGDDYAWDDREDDYAGYDVPPRPLPCNQPCAAPGYGYGYSHAYPGYGYGHGWMHGGMITVTETTVHAAAPQTVRETVYIEKPAKTTKRRTYKRTKVRPLPGERG